LPPGQNEDEWLISCLANDVTNWRNVKMFSPFHKKCDASVVSFLLGDSSVSDVYMPMFCNALSVPSS
jgi:hypothetical protein